MGFRHGTERAAGMLARALFWFMVISMVVGVLTAIFH